MAIEDPSYPFQLSLPNIPTFSATEQPTPQQLYVAILEIYKAIRVIAGEVGSGGGGSYELDGDVLAGPGTGLQTALFDLNVRHEWEEAQNVKAVTLTDASTVTASASASNNFFLLLTNAVGSSRTMNKPSGTLNAGDIVNYECKQPSSGGPCTITWNTSDFLWGPGGQDAQPTASEVNGASDFYSFTVESSGKLHGVMIGQSGPTGPGYWARSTSSISLGTGSKTLTVGYGLAYSVGARARFAASSTQYMDGNVVTYQSGILTILSDTVVGSGTFAVWTVNIAGDIGIQGIPGSANFAGTSTTSQTIGVGSLVFTTQAGLAYQVGSRVRIANSAAPANFVDGIVTAYSGTSLTLNSDTVGGSGTFSSWNLSISGNPGINGIASANLSSHAVYAYRNAAYTPTAATYVKIAFNAELHDTSNEFDTTLSRWTPTAPGWYGVAVQVASNTNALVLAEVWKNGARYASGSASNIGANQSEVFVYVYCNGSTDYIEGYCYVSTGTIGGTTYQTYLSGMLCGVTGSGVPRRYWVGTGAGDYTTASSTFVDLTGATTSIPASVGDILEIDFDSVVYAGSGTPGQIGLLLIVAGSTSLGGTHTDIGSSNIAQNGLIRITRVVVASDISGGLVTFKVQWKRTGSGNAAMLNGSATVGYLNLPILTVRNYGDGSGVPAKAVPLSVDNFPSSPNAADDEFEYGIGLDTTGARRSGATPWTWRNQGAATAVVTNGVLLLKAPASTTTNLRIIEQPCSGSWEYTAKLRSSNLLPATQFAAAKLIASNSANGRSFEFGREIDSAGVNRLNGILRASVTLYNSTPITSINFTSETNSNATDFMYFRYISNGTTITAQFSYEGNIWITAGAITIATYLLAVDRIGLLVNNENNSDHTNIIDWFRKTA